MRPLTSGLVFISDFLPVSSGRGYVCLGVSVGVSFGWSGKGMRSGLVSGTGTGNVGVVTSVGFAISGFGGSDGTEGWVGSDGFGSDEGIAGTGADGLCVVRRAEDCEPSLRRGCPAFLAGLCVEWALALKASKMLAAFAATKKFAFGTPVNAITIVVVTTRMR